MVASIPSPFSLPIGGIVVSLLGGSLVKGTAVLVLVFLVAAALRRTSAGTRHVVWSAGLTAILALPILSSALPWRVEVVPALAPVLVSGAGLDDRTEPPLVDAMSAAPLPGDPLREGPTGPGTKARPSAEVSDGVAGKGAAGAEAEEGSFGAEASANASARRTGVQPAGGRHVPGGDLSGNGYLPPPESVLWWLTVMWAVGALVLLVWLGQGTLAARRVTRRSKALESADWMKPLWEAADRLDLPQVPRLVMSDGVDLPFTCGLFRSTIVLPASASEWTDDRRRAVLFHELGHIRRRDLVSHLIGRLACAVYWFHPLVWLAARRARAASERACDDLVLSTGTRPSAYADHLLQILCGAAKASAPVVAIPMAQRKEFEGRMLAILESDVPRRGPNRLQTATLVGSVAVLALSVAALAPIPANASSEVADAIVKADMIPRATIDGGQGADDTSSANHGVDDDSEAEEPLVNKASDEVPRAADRGISVAKAETPATAAVASTYPRRSPKPSAAANIIASSRDGVARGDEPNEPQVATDRAQEDARVAALTTALSDPLTAVRLTAAHTLGETGDSAAVAALSAALRTDSSAEVRRMAAWALGEIGEPAAVPALSAAVREDEDAEVRGKAAWALGEIEDERAIEALGAATTDADPTVAKTAVWALGEIGSPSAAPYLTPALRSPHAEIRRQAAHALAETEAAAAVEPLIAALRDEDVEVRSTAAWGLGELEAPRAVPALAEALDDGSVEVRRQAARAIGELEPSAAPEALIAALRDADEEVRKSAVWALGEIADPTSAEALTAALDDSSPEIRRTAFWALGEIGGPIAQEVLLEAIRSEDPEIRKMAVRALAEFY